MKRSQVSKLIISIIFILICFISLSEAKNHKNLKHNNGRKKHNIITSKSPTLKQKINSVKNGKSLKVKIEDNEKEEKTIKAINSRAFKMPRVPLKANPLGKRGSFSRIAYGTLHWTEIDEAQAVELLKVCLDSGVTTFDLADVYGMGVSTELFGKAFKTLEAERGPLRDKVQLVAKWGIRIDPSYYVDSSEEHMRYSADEFLRLAQTDYIDVFMLHNPDDNADYNQIARVANDLINEGKIKHFSMSNHKKYQFDQMKAAMDAYGMNIVTHEMEYSVLHPQNMDDGTISYMDELDIPVLAWGPSGGNNMGGQLPKNLLFEVYQEREVRIVEALNTYAKLISEDTTPEQMAVAWVLHQKSSNLIPILGSVQTTRLQQQIDVIQISNQQAAKANIVEGIRQNIYRK